MKIKYIIATVIGLNASKIVKYNTYTGNVQVAGKSIVCPQQHCSLYDLVVATGFAVFCRFLFSSRTYC